MKTALYILCLHRAFTVQLEISPLQREVTFRGALRLGLYSSPQSIRLSMCEDPWNAWFVILLCINILAKDHHK